MRNGHVTRLPRPLNKRVLIVEDDCETGYVVGLILDQMECIHEPATSVEAARSILTAAAGRKAPPIDLILLDLTLPDADPTEALLQLKELGVPVPPVVILSARPTRQIERAAARVGAARAVQKPFEVDDLISAIQAALDAERAETLAGEGEVA